MDEKRTNRVKLDEYDRWLYESRLVTFLDKVQKTPHVTGLITAENWSQKLKEHGEDWVHEFVSGVLQIKITDMSDGREPTTEECNAYKKTTKSLGYPLVLEKQRVTDWDAESAFERCARKFGGCRVRHRDDSPDSDQHLREFYHSTAQAGCTDYLGHEVDDDRKLEQCAELFHLLHKGWKKVDTKNWVVRNYD